MEQYIPKAAVAAEIENIEADAICQYKTDKSRYAEGSLDVIHRIKHLLDTLEVKEVDLEKYYHEFLQKEWFGNSHVRTISEMMAFTAKHFFELGLKAQKGG